MTTEFDVQTQHWVFVTHITNPLDFYVRPTKYRVIIEHLESTQPQIKKAELKLNDVIMFKKNNSDGAKYARGKILGIETQENVTKYDIFALDYGCFCKAIPEEYIWECIPDYAIIQPLAVACQLANCIAIAGDEWSLGSINAFKCYIADEKTKMLILDKTSHKLIVELRNFNFNDIATLLAETGYSTLGYDHNAVSESNKLIPEIKNFSYKDIQVDNKLRVRVQSAKSLSDFYVIEVNDYRNYLRLCDKMAYYADKQPTLPKDQMKKDTIVLLKNDKHPDFYERAVIRFVIIPGTLAIVKLVDTGLEDVVYIKNMKTISQECLKLPVSTFYCATEGQSIWNNILGRNLNPGSILFIKIRQLSNSLDTPNIVSISAFQ